MSLKGKRPELCQLMNLLTCISARWKLLGDQLEVEANFIECLEKSTESDKTKLRDVLQKWIEMKPTPVTWENIINVVGGPVIQKQDVAMTIKESLMEIRIKYRRAKRQSEYTIYGIILQIC